jgi:hypothetical protein
LLRAGDEVHDPRTSRLCKWHTTASCAAAFECFLIVRARFRPFADYPAELADFS